MEKAITIYGVPRACLTYASTATMTDISRKTNNAHYYASRSAGKLTNTLPSRRSRNSSILMMQKNVCKGMMQKSAGPLSIYAKTIKT
jgi:hypothetical protein